MARKKLAVAFQGEPGAFSHAAACKLLGVEIALRPSKTFKVVFEKLKCGQVSHAVIHIENTLHGSVHENYDYLLDYDFHISGETSIRISHQLIAMPGVSFRQIRQVLSHPVALNQCKLFFDKYPRLQPMPYYDTAGSVKALQEQGLKDTAAIASETAAGTYAGVILKRNIEDIRQNFTRFFLLTGKPAGPSAAGGQRKTSLVFSTANVPGALFRAMACFAMRDLSLTKIESRPYRGKPWEYLFYVDFLGDAEDAPVRSAIENLREFSQFVKLLG